MNWTPEFVMALAAFFTALGGIGVGIFRFGQLAQRVDQLEKDASRLEAALENARRDSRAGLDKILERIDKIWEWLHENVTRRSTDSKPE